MGRQTLPDLQPNEPAVLRPGDRSHRVDEVRRAAFLFVCGKGLQCELACLQLLQFQRARVVQRPVRCAHHARAGLARHFSACACSMLMMVGCCLLWQRLLAGFYVPLICLGKLVFLANLS